MRRTTDRAAGLIRGRGFGAVRFALALLWCCVGVGLARAQELESTRSPFEISVATNVGGGLKVEFIVPEDCVLYAERLHFYDEGGTELLPTRIPSPVVKTDKASGREKKIYDRNFRVQLPAASGNLEIKFQGCTNAACYFPEKRTFAMNTKGVFVETTASEPGLVAVTPDPNAPSSDWESAAKDFEVVARETGYIKPNDFIQFLNRSASGSLQASSDPLAKYKRFGLLATLCLILIGGAGLNLTPCVLPLIPINMAIIFGTGKGTHTRREGFLHGTAYGLGMSLTYGILGLAVVLTGAKFGTLNSSVWFNVAIALVFVVLALAMFDVFHIDFTRFDRRLGKQESKAAHKSKSHWLVAFSLGVIAALLAGACVAPVVISVLLMAANFYAKGAAIGLALPFVLGLGMASPWPFAGAGLAYIPKPGRWMVWVKYAFGMLILLFAGYYGNLAYGLFKTQRAMSNLAAGPGAAARVEGVNQSLTKALSESRASGKPVFVDFAASWCKNCEAMDLTVFSQSNVQKRLNDFIVVKYLAERPSEPPARDVLDHFKVMGLPTYVVMTPK